MRTFLRSKIHKARVTEANVDYVGSVTIDAALMEKAGLLEYEKVLIASNTSGNRVETYVMKGTKNSGTICMNGAAAHLIAKGEEVIIMAFETCARKPGKPRNVLVDRRNRFVKYL
jgi:aspartate 1-decarboxylase